jgi:hypothetical protein
MRRRGMLAALRAASASELGLVPRPRDSVLPLPYSRGSVTGRNRDRKGAEWCVQIAGPADILPAGNVTAVLNSVERLMKRALHFLARRSMLRQAGCKAGGAGVAKRKSWRDTKIA